MKSLVFVDSNVILYEIDDSEPEKQAKARNAIRDLGTRRVVSNQILQEVYWNATRRIGVPPQQARLLVDTLRKGRCVALQPDQVVDAIDTSIRWQISMWDALLFEAAVAGGCKTLLTEDLNHGQVIRGVKIVNPFI